MNRPLAPATIGYFGKIPARSDFVKATDNVALAGLLDQWLASVMNQLSVDPRWKHNYDALQPLHFAFVGTRSRHAIAGHVVASGDQSQRRFPFIAMCALDTEQAHAFLPLSPIALGPLWDGMALRCAQVLASGDPAAPLQALATMAVDVDPADARHQHAFEHFLQTHTVAGLEALLGQNGVPVSARQLILSVGLLLQPFRWSGSVRLEKSLALPLPMEPALRYQTAAFWLALVTPFLRDADVELALFCTEARGRASLVIGFSGASPETLQAIIDPQYAQEQQIAFDNTDWVDGMITGDHDVRRLSVCLEQGELPLQAACTLFHEIFR